MSQRHHSALAIHANQIVSQIYDMDMDQINEFYGIEIDSEGQVYDPAYDKWFSSLSAWANWSVANEEYTEKERIQHYNYGAFT